MPAPSADQPRESHDAFDSRPSSHSLAVPDLPAAADLLAGQYELQDQLRDRHHHDAVAASAEDRKSTRLNSSHANISYAVFCLKKKNLHKTHNQLPFERAQSPHIPIV